MIVFRLTLIFGFLLVTGPVLARGAKGVSNGVSASASLERTDRDTPPEHCERAEEVQNMPGLVAEDGNLLDTCVCHSAGHEALDHEVLQALEQSEWRPGTVGGELVPVAMKYPVWFGTN